jgi:Cof subfamily protein (haloacid dehalogenase superfamily)
VKIKETYKMYKAVISDLDGTLLNSKHRVSDYTKEVIKKIVDKGTKFLIATGRHHVDAGEIRDSLGLNTILISSNGARVHSGDGVELYAKNIEPDVAEELLALNIDDAIYSNAYVGDNWFVERDNEYIKAFIKDSMFSYRIIDFTELDLNNISKFTYLCENHEKLVELQEALRTKFQGKLNITFSLPTCLDVMAKGVSKGRAIEIVLKGYGIEPEECVAFGDGLNDFEMLKFVGNGVLMGNASPKLRELLSENEVTCTNDEDGVAKYLEEVI